MKAVANTYTQIYLHIVFAVSGRACCISENHREELQKYITGIATSLEQKLIAIYCMPDHTHILLGYHPSKPLPEVVGKIKTGSTNLINEQRWLGCRFRWQEGYGAFSVSQSDLGRVITYIRNQPERHRQRTFQEEYIAFLERYAVDFDQKYIFKPND